MARVNSTTYTINVDVKNQKELDRLQKQLEKLQQQRDKLSRRQDLISFKSDKPIKSILYIYKELGKLDKRIVEINKKRLEIRDKELKRAERSFKNLTNALSEYLAKRKKLIATQKLRLKFGKDIEDTSKQLVVVNRRIGKLQKLLSRFPIELKKQKILSMDSTIKAFKTINTELNRLKKQKNVLIKALGERNRLQQLDKQIQTIEKDLEKLQKAEKKLESSTGIKTFSSRVGNLQQSLRNLKPTFNSMAVILSGLSSILLNVGMSALKEAADWEILRMKLENFYQSAEVSQKMFNKLVVMAKTTPFEIKGLVKSAVMLKSFGLDVDKTITLAGDLAAALGGDVTQASYAVARALSGASFGFLMLQRSWGISYAKLRRYNAEFISGNKLMASSVKTQQALLRVLEEYRGSMERMSSTLVGRLSNLSDAFNTLKEASARAFIPMGTTVVRVLTFIIDKFNELPTIMKSATVAMTLFVGSITYLGAVVFKVLYRIPDLLAGLKALGLEAYYGATAMQTLSNVFTAASTRITAFATANAALLGTLGAVAVAVGLVYYKITKYREEARKAEIEANALAKGIQDLGQAFGGGTSYVNIFNNIMNITKENAGKVLKQLQGVKEGVYDVTTELGVLFTNSEEELLGLQQQAMEAAQARVNEMKKNVKETTEQLEKLQKKLDPTLLARGLITAKEYNMRAKEIEDLEKSLKLYKEKQKLYEKEIKQIPEKIRILQREMEEEQKLAAESLQIYEEVEDRKEELGILGVAAQREAVKQLLSLEGITYKARVQYLEKWNKLNNKLSKVSVQQIEEQYKKSLETIKMYLEESLIDREEYLRQSKKLEEMYLTTKKLAQENLKNFGKTWKQYLKEQKIKLKTGEQNYKQYIENLKKFEQDYNDFLGRNKDVQLSIQTEIANAKVKIVKESAKKLKQEWSLYFKQQKTLLNQNKITFKEYADSLKSFLVSHATELEKMPELRTSIENKIASASVKINKKMNDSILKLHIERLKAEGQLEEAKLQEQLLNLRQWYIEQVKVNGKSLELTRTYLAKKEQIYKEHYRRLNEANIKIAADMYKAMTGKTDFSEYITKTHALDEQRRQYEELGVNKLELDRWYYTMKKQLDEEYLANVVLQNRKIYNSKVALYTEIMEVYLKKQQQLLSAKDYLQEESKVLEEQIKLIEGRIALEKNSAEQILLRFRAGQRLSEKEQEILDIYLKDIEAHDELLDKKDQLIGKAISLYKTELNNYKSFLEMQVQTGMLSKEDAFRMQAQKFTEMYSSLADKVLPLLEKPFEELSIQQKELIKQWNDEVIPMIDKFKKESEELGVSFNATMLGVRDFGNAVSTGTSRIENLARATQDMGRKATSAIDSAKSSMESYTKTIKKATDNMKQFGNITASTTGTTPSGGGGFMTVEEALSNLPGSRANWETPMEIPSWMVRSHGNVGPRGGGYQVITIGTSPVNAIQYYGTSPFREGTTGGRRQPTAEVVLPSQSQTPLPGHVPAPAEGITPVQGRPGQGQQYPANYIPVSERNPFGYSGPTYENPINDAIAKSEGKFFTREIISRSAFDMMRNFLEGTVEEMRGLGGQLASRFLSDVAGQGSNLPPVTNVQQIPTVGKGVGEIPQNINPIESFTEAKTYDILLNSLDTLKEYVEVSDEALDKREQEFNKLVDIYKQNLSNLELLQEIKLAEKEITEEQALRDRQDFIEKEKEALEETVKILKEKADTEGVSRLTEAEINLLEVYNSQIRALEEIKIRLAELQNIPAEGTSTGMTTITEATTQGEQAIQSVQNAQQEQQVTTPLLGMSRERVQEILSGEIPDYFRHVTQSVAQYLTRIFGQLPSFVQTVGGQPVGNMNLVATGGAGQGQVINNYNMNFGQGNVPVPVQAQPHIQSIATITSQDFIERYVGRSNLR